MIYTKKDNTSPEPVSYSGQVKLLEMTYERLRFSVMAIPAVALGIVLYYARDHDATMLIVWGLAYILAAVAMQWGYHHIYLNDKQSLSDEYLAKKWQSVLQKIALVHGLGLTTAVVITAGHASFEFSILLHITLAAITAGNATHQTPLLGVFWRFFLTGWNMNVALIYWVFPTQWQFLLPLSLLYSLGMYKHALTAHHFFINQVRLEDQGVKLAAQYKLAKEQAETALLEKNQFLSTASHDLRQPIHAMGMLVEAVATRNHDAALQPLIGDLKSSIRSINLMFNSLLDLSRLEAGQAAIAQVPVSLGNLMQDVAVLFREEARAQQLELRIHQPGKNIHPMVLADPNLLRQALVNLVHNALRYTKQGGVLMGARKRGDAWQLEVWDTGIGVADGEHEQIYSPYYRNQHAWRVDSTGYGLGLHVVARCAKLMGASYGLSSRLGQGSRFWLKLTAAQCSDLSQLLAQTADFDLNAQSLHPLQGRCLILEDDPQVTAAWAALMEAWHVDARYATCAKEAFAALDAGFEPKAILCDQRLRSGESGFDILRDLLEKLPQARGAMVSGEFASSELLEAENDGYLVLRKPLEATQVHAMLSRWFNDHDHTLASV